jgi:hypothetical protein
MIELHSGMQAGLSPAAALAHIQLTHLQDNPRADPGAIAAAAGFICFGAG